MAAATAAAEESRANAPRAGGAPLYRITCSISAPPPPRPPVYVAQPAEYSDDVPHRTPRPPVDLVVQRLDAHRRTVTFGIKRGLPLSSSWSGAPALCVVRHRAARVVAAAGGRGRRCRHVNVRTAVGTLSCPTLFHWHPTLSHATAIPPSVLRAGAKFRLAIVFHIPGRVALDAADFASLSSGGGGGGGGGGVPEWDVLIVLTGSFRVMAKQVRRTPVAA